jgi:hypothetical protein
MLYEYKVVQIGTVMSGTQQSILCHEAEDEWRLVAVDDGYAYLERPRPNFESGEDLRDVNSAKL